MAHQKNDPFHNRNIKWQPFALIMGSFCSNYLFSGHPLTIMVDRAHKPTSLMARGPNCMGLFSPAYYMLDIAPILFDNTLKMSLDETVSTQRLRPCIFCLAHTCNTNVTNIIKSWTQLLGMGMIKDQNIR